jgi:hypothetical protein
MLSNPVRDAYLTAVSVGFLPMPHCDPDASFRQGVVIDDACAPDATVSPRPMPPKVRDVAFAEGVAIEGR